MKVESPFSGAHVGQQRRLKPHVPSLSVNCATMGALKEGAIVLNGIALIGMPGSGKSTVGRLLSEARGFRYVDLDDEIATAYNSSIPTLFSTIGEAGFRALELKHLNQQTSQQLGPPIVLATGGGIVVTPACRELLKSAWWTVYLKTELDGLCHRLETEQSGRPLLSGDEPLRTKLEFLLTARSHHYASCATLTISTDGQTPEQLVAIILAALPQSLAAVGEPRSQAWNTL